MEKYLQHEQMKGELYSDQVAKSSQLIPVFLLGKKYLMIQHFKDHEQKEILASALLTKEQTSAMIDELLNILSVL